MLGSSIVRCGCGALIGRQMIYQKINFLQQQQQQPPHSSGDDGTRISSPLIVIMLLLLMLASVTPHAAVSAAVQVPTLSNNQHWSHGTLAQCAVTLLACRNWDW